MEKQAIEKALDTIRPGLRADGGDVVLMDVSDSGQVLVKLTGSCGGCPFSTMTLKNSIEATLKKMVPGVTSVVSV